MVRRAVGVIKSTPSENEILGLSVTGVMAGRWKVKVHVLTQDLETMITDFKVHVGSQ